MKRTVYLLLALTLLWLQSCVKEEKDLFDQPAAQRISATLKEYNKILQETTNGWKMEYFPETDRSMGGYTYFCTFKDGEATLMGDFSLTVGGKDEYPAGTEVTSLYRLISDQGPVLSFDSYNPILHFFSEPKSVLDTDGYAGDYEFVFMKAEAGKIILQGKKYGNTMVMTRLDTPAKEELDRILQMQKLLAKMPYERIDIGGKTYPLLLDYNNRQFILPTGTDEETASPQEAFLFTEKGIKFYQPLQVEGESLSEFIFSPEDKTLREAKAAATVRRTPWIDILAQPETQYMFDFNVEQGRAAMNDELFDLLKEGYEANKLKGGELFLIMYIGKNHLDNDSGPYVMAFGSNTSGLSFDYPSYGCTFAATGENKDQLSITIDKENSTQMWWYTWCEPIADYIAAHSPYRLEDAPADSDNNIKCVSVVDPHVWFELK